MAALAEINAVWIGPELGPIHVACLCSFLRHGHRVTLHCYSPPRDVPDGVTVADATKLLPASMIFQAAEAEGYEALRSGGYEAFSNLLRYEICRAGLGLYVDCDFYCVRPIPDDDYIFGLASHDFIPPAGYAAKISNAILKLPPDCPALSELLILKEGREAPIWLTPKEREQLNAASGSREPLRGRDLLRLLPYGASGPAAVTHVFHKYELLDHARPYDIFLPLSFRHVRLLVDPGVTLEDLCTRRTLAIHLFHKHLTRLGPYSKDSPLGQIVNSVL